MDQEERHSGHQGHRRDALAQGEWAVGGVGGLGGSWLTSEPGLVNFWVRADIGAFLEYSDSFRILTI